MCIVLAAAVVTDWILIKKLESGYREEDSYRKDKICEELQVFPVPKSTTDQSLTWEYVDSWMTERTFGGDRQHEGCDLMMTRDIRGIYPVVSMTDGVIENVGWLRLGGYRIGIRSPGGNYYYYAHMESYAENICEGMRVKAGEFLGFVGDSGYGGEGTTGQFAVHLHVGIYIPDREGNDQAVNPYPYLKSLEEDCIFSDYGEPGKDESR